MVMFTPSTYGGGVDFQLNVKLSLSNSEQFNAAVSH